MINVHFIEKMGTDLTVVNAARISFNTEHAELTEGDLKLIDYLAKNEHLSPFEHCSITVMIECPLYIRSQIHRHRTFAYNEVSRRYTSENLEFYIPPTDDVRAQSKSNKQGSEGPVSPEVADFARAGMELICKQSLDVFNRLIEMGVAREQARAILPQALMTKFYMTGNLRNFAHFVRLRVDAHAQKEAQYIGRQVQAIMLEQFPAASAALFLHQTKG